MNWIPESWSRIETIDAHTEGEPLRVILAGFPQARGSSVLERRNFIRETHDDLRRALMWEPRGHADMYGCLVMPPVTEQADFSVLFLHNEGYSTMCGHGIIAVSKVMVEAGYIPKTTPETKVQIDSPAGLVSAYVRIVEGRATSVYFDNVPSYVVELGSRVDVPSVGMIEYDLAFGGAYYAYVDAGQIEAGLRADSARELIETGMAIKRAVMAERTITHPFEADLGFLYGTIFIGPPESEGAHSRNVCVFAEGEVDRSPTGTGVSGRLAIHHAKDEVAVGQEITIESIIGSTFRASVVATTSFGPYEAVIPRVEGRAFVTGRHEFLIDPYDPLKDGFIIR